MLSWIRMVRNEGLRMARNSIWYDGFRPKNRTGPAQGHRLSTRRFRQGCAALEEQAGAFGGSLAKERVQCPADPEVLFHVADRSAEPVGGREKQIEAVTRGRGDELPVYIGSHCRGPSASAVRSNPRRNSCIQIGKAASPALRSSRMDLPCRGSAKRHRSLASTC